MKPKSAKKRPKNMSISPRILDVAEAYCRQSARKLSPYVEELLREDLRKKGMPVDATREEVDRYISEHMHPAVVKPRASRLQASRKIQK